MHCTQLLEHESKLISIGYNISLNDRQLHLVVKNITKESGIGIESKFQSLAPPPSDTQYIWFLTCLSGPGSNLGSTGL